MLAIPSLWALFVVAGSSVPTVQPTSAASGRIQRSTPRPGAVDSGAVVYGESAASRTIYTVVSMVSLSLLTGVLGYRARQLERQHFRSLNLTRILAFILSLFAISFVTSAAVVESGLVLSTPSICYSAIAICLAFYVGSKIIMYIFLVERAHAIRAPYVRRSSDWIWLCGVFVIATGFGSIAICAFLWPIAYLSQTDGRCRIGLPFKVTIPLLTFDVTINLALTAAFIYLLKPLLRFRGAGGANDSGSRLTKGIRRMLSNTEHAHSEEIYPINQNFRKSIEALLWRSLIGSVLVMLPTVGNLAVLYSLEGRELGWLCLTICTVDVTWAVAVIHWLTVGSMEVDERALVMLVQGNASSASTGPAPSL